MNGRAIVRDHELTEERSGTLLRSGRDTETVAAFDLDPSVHARSSRERPALPPQPHGRELCRLSDRPAAPRASTCSTWAAVPARSPSTSRPACRRATSSDSTPNPSIVDVARDSATGRPERDVPDRRRVRARCSRRVVRHRARPPGAPAPHRSRRRAPRDAARVQARWGGGRARLRLRGDDVVSGDPCAHPLVVAVPRRHAEQRRRSRRRTSAPRVGTRRGLLRRALVSFGVVLLHSRRTGMVGRDLGRARRRLTVRRTGDRARPGHEAKTSPRSPPAGRSGARPTTVGSRCCTARSSARPEALLLLVRLRPGADPEDVPVGVAKVELAYAPHFVDGWPRDLQALAHARGAPRRRRRRRSTARRRRRRVHPGRRRTERSECRPRARPRTPGGTSGSGDQANPGRKPDLLEPLGACVPVGDVQDRRELHCGHRAER